MDCTTQQSDSDIQPGNKIEGVTSLNYRDKTWNATQLIVCHADETNSEAEGQKNSVDMEALKTAYGDRTPSDYSLGTLYSMCASTAFTQMSLQPMTIPQANELLGAITICPDHPRAAEIKQKVEADINLNNQIANKRTQGLIKDEGTYKVPDEISPGTWKTMNEKVIDCYWEIQDANGQILDNNFTASGIAQTISIPNNAAGFTSHGCGSWEKQ